MANRARAFQHACRSRIPSSSSSGFEKFGHTPSAPSSALTTTAFSSSAPRTLLPFLTLGQREFSTSVLLSQASHSRRPAATASIPSASAAVARYLPQVRNASTSTSSSSSGSSRRAITVTSDDGRYNWSELSTGEKAARGTQQTFNFLLISLGLAGTITITYLLYTELFAPSSSTVQFNAAVARVKASSECRALLGPAREIRAFGEPTSNKWARARPLAHSTEIDRFGTTHLRMHFNVEGPEGRGVVAVHMTSRPREAGGTGALEYQVLSLSVKGHETVYLENKDAERGVKSKVGKMFGVQWR